MTDEQLPERSLRASDKDRDTYAMRLREALTEGRLTESEFNERLDRLFASRTYGDLVALTADLPTTEGALDVRHTVPATHPARFVSPVFGVFGGSTVRPSGPVKGVTFVASLLGFSCIDLRNTVIANDGLTINVFAAYGAAELILPPDANVQVFAVPILGAVQHDKENVAIGGPLVRINVVTVFGGVRIGRKPLWSPDEDPLKRNKKIDG